MAQLQTINGMLSSTWINCTDAKSKCENNDWLLGGVQGKCQPSTGICICPTGYNGLDDFDYYNDCHVSINTRDKIRLAAMIISFIAFIVSMYLTIKLFFKWGIIYIPKEVTEIDAQSLDNSNPDAINAPLVASPNAPLPNLSSLASSQKSTPSLIESQTRPRTSFEPLIPKPHVRFSDNNNGNNSPDPENGFAPIDIVQTPLPVIEESQRETVSQRYGFMALQINNQQENQNGDDASKQGKGSSNDNSGNNKTVVTSRSATTNKGAASTSGWIQPFKCMIPRKLPRTSMKLLKQFLPMTASPSGQKKSQVEEMKRKRRTFILVVLCLAFSFFMGIYTLLLIFGGESHRNNDVALDVILMFILDSVLLGIWTLAYIWYGSLPNLATYGKLFKVDSILIRHPSLVPRLMVLNSLLVIILTCLFIIVFPRVFITAQYELDSALMFFGCVELIVFGSTFSSICYLLNESFNSMLHNPLIKRSAKREGAEDAILRARNTVRFGAFIGVVACSICSLLFFLMGAAPVVRTNLWLIAPLMIAIGCSVELLIMYVVIIRTGGGTAHR